MLKKESCADSGSLKKESHCEAQGNMKEVKVGGACLSNPVNHITSIYRVQITGESHQVFCL